MKKIFFAFLCVFVFSTFAFGKFLTLSIEENVKGSNLIVIGSLINVSETETKESKFSKGTLVIDKIVYGNFINSNGQSLKSGYKVQVEWQNSKMIACQFGFSENERQIWFLKVDNEGNINSLSHSTTASLAELAEVKKYLKKQKSQDKIEKTIKQQKEIQKVHQTDSVQDNNSKSFYSLDNEPFKQKGYSPFSAFLVILTSFGLYLVLYKSRFKIR
jgi:hypothetical protein